MQANCDFANFYVNIYQIFNELIKNSTLSIVSPYFVHLRYCVYIYFSYVHALK